jgi:hypothetical protein
MEALLAAWWRTYPAVALILFGLGCCAWAAVRDPAGLGLPMTDRRKGFALARWLRTTILGLALVAVGAGWLCQHATVIGVALVILGEEMLEISVVLAAMRMEPGLAEPVSMPSRC